MAPNSKQWEKEEWSRANFTEPAHPRVLAAIWFACAACIPGLIVLLISSIGGERKVFTGAIIFILCPAAVACLYGALLGEGILDSRDVTTGSQSFRRGASIAFATFVTFMPLSIFIVNIINPLTPQAATPTVGLFITIMFYGFILVGWWSVLIGGIAGWLLYRWHR